MKSLKKMLKSELEKVVPPLNENVKNMPIATDPSTVSANGGNTLTRSKKNAIAGIVALVLVFLIIGLSLGLTLPHRGATDGFFFTVEINPSVTVATDERGIVTDIISSNSDADVILSNKDAKSQIIGKSLDKAVVAYADYAGKLGFIDPNKKGSAVRISACEKGNELLLNTQNALQSYFIEKGIFAVVIGETVNLSEFSERSGIASASFDQLADALKNCNTLFGDRTAQNADDSTILTLYKEFVLSSELVPVVKDYLLDNMGLIEQFEAFYPFISSEQIKGILEDFSAELLRQYSNIFADVLQLIGKDSVIVKIMKTPKNVQEYLDKLIAVLDIEFTQRLKKFEDAYNEIRDITEEYYNAFVDDIIETYGSLNDYWKAIK